MLKQLKNIELQGEHFAELSATYCDGFNKIILFRVCNPSAALESKNSKVEIQLPGFNFPKELESYRGRALALSSHLEYNLRNFLIRYFKKNTDLVSNFLTSKFQKELIDNDYIFIISKLDFMAKRKILSNILEKDIIYQKDKIKTKLFYDYIMERNKYGHGVICMLSPDRKYVLKYGEIYGQAHYAFIEEQNLTSFIEISKTLQKWIYELGCKLKTN